MKKLLAALLWAALAVTGGQALAGTPKDTLVMAKDMSDIITLDPAEVFEFTGGELTANIYDRVMMFEPEDLTTLVGGVAESYEISADGKTVTLKVRPGQTFHSGNPVTAEDVAFSLQRSTAWSRRPTP
jgi:peptide/nickel transport system substrate-binding protein